LTGVTFEGAVAGASLTEGEKGGRGLKPLVLGVLMNLLRRCKKTREKWEYKCVSVTDKHPCEQKTRRRKSEGVSNNKNREAKQKNRGNAIAEVICPLANLAQDKKDGISITISRH